MKAGTVTGAGERLGLTQPAVSKILSGLEAEIGCTLFLRQRKRLLPTREALLLLREATRIFRGMEDLGDFMQTVRNLEGGDLHIVTTPSVGEAILPAVMAQFLQERPRLHVRYEIRHSDIVNQRVVEQQTDLGFTMVPFDHPSISSDLLFQVPAMCALPRAHRLASRRRIRAQDLEGEVFISFLKDARMRHLIDALFEQQGVSRVLQHEVYSSPEACALVCCGVGVALVEPLSARRVASPDMVLRPFDPAVSYTFKVLRPRLREASRLAEAFLALTHQHIAGMATAEGLPGLLVPPGRG